MALYEVLIDDDEEIREIGAGVVSQLVGKSLCPYAAAGEFMIWLGIVGCESNISLALSYYAALRLTGQWHEAGSVAEMIANDFFDSGAKNLPEQCFPSVWRLLPAALKDNNDLFVREKPNLYVDEVREAEIWSEFLISLGTKNVLEKNILKELAAWVAEGEQVLHKLALGNYESLGKTRKSAVYTIRMRVMYGRKAIDSLGLKN